MDDICNRIGGYPQHRVFSIGEIFTTLKTIGLYHRPPAYTDIFKTTSEVVLELDQAAHLSPGAVLKVVERLESPAYPSVFYLCLERAGERYYCPETHAAWTVDPSTPDNTERLFAALSELKAALKKGEI